MHIHIKLRFPANYIDYENYIDIRFLISRMGGQKNNYPIHSERNFPYYYECIAHPKRYLRIKKRQIINKDVCNTTS